MKVFTKFDIGEKFKINRNYMDVMCCSKEDIFKIDSIRIDKYGVYYAYYKFPAHENRDWNRKYRGREYIAEFAMAKMK